MPDAGTAAIAPVLAAAAVATVASAAMTRSLIAIGHRAGALDSAGAPGHVKELRPVPNIGGVAVAASVLVPLAAALALAAGLGGERLADWAPSLAESAARLGDTARPALAILLGALALHLTGVVDDRRALRPLPKLLVQRAVAFGTVSFGGVRALTFLDAYPGGIWVSVLLSGAFIVAIVNAVNFLDNMDGLSGGVSAIAAAALCVAACVARQWATAGVLALLAGGLLGFLVYNFPWRAGQRARIFLGDGGTLPVGFLLSALAIQITFTSPGDPGYALGTHWYGALAPVVILAVPIYDSVVVTLLRLSQGKSPMVGDHQHFSHRMVMRGFTQRGAVLLICAFGVVCSTGGLLLGTAEPWQAALVALQTGIVMVAIAALERPMLARMRAGERP